MIAAGSIFAATGLSLPALVAVMLMAFGAAAIRGLTGFGMAIILVPLLCIVMRPDAAVIVAIVLQFLIGPVGIVRIVSDAHRHSALPMLIAAVLTVPIGLWLLAVTPPDLARVMIALVAIVAFLIVVIPRQGVTMPTRGNAVVSGLIAGVLTGFAAMPGPPVVVHYLRAGFTPAMARASMMMVFFATATAGTMGAAVAGLIDGRIVTISTIMFVPMLLGNWLGGLGFGRVSAPVWRSAVAILLGLAGLSALVRLFGQPFG